MLMHLSRRRVVAAVLAVVVVVAAALARQRDEPPSYTFRVTLGLHDKQPTDWDGQVAVTGGTVTALTGWRFEEKDAVAKDLSGWKCRTHNYIVPGDRYALQKADGKAPPAPQEAWPNGITLRVRGAAPNVTLTLRAGEVKFATADVPLGEPKAFLDARVRVERLPDAAVLRGPDKGMHAVQDDYPAFWVRYRTRKHYLAWVAYQEEKDRVLLVERDGPDGTWSEPVEVAGPGDHFRVALAGTHDDTVWVVWSSQRDHDWDLYGRAYKDGKLGPEVRLTEAPGPDIWHVMTTDSRGRAWLVWQGFRDGQADILARCADSDGWHDPVRVSSSRANDWNPAVAADPKEDRVWVGWDTYDTGSYGVRVRAVSGGPKGQIGDVLTPEESPRFGAHVSLACDRDGRLWAAWDQSGQQWGKDAGFLYQDTTGTKLYASRQVRLKVLADGKWLEPAADWAASLEGEAKEFNELPQLQPDADGRMWLLFRYRTCRRPRVDGWAIQARWNVYATAFLGDRWTEPVELPHSDGRNDMRMSTQRDREGSAYVAYASDNRVWTQPAMPPQNLSVAVGRLGGAAKPGEGKFVERRAEVVAVKPVHPREKEQVARVRGYKVEAGGKTYRIYRGDMHRHTDISGDGMGDGSLMDLHRYGLDAAAFDFILVTDHNMGGDKEYPWWRTQKANDLYTVPGAFISMYGYERSVPYPNGHRNIVWAERGHRTLPLPQAAIAAQMKADTGKLYAYLRETHGLCTAHTSATQQGTNWEEFDGSLEPIVEIFQGFHTSYEEPGAPKTVDDKTDQVHGPYKPDGYVSKALAKGYRLGFQSSSDHVSTHVSYACLLAEEFSRRGLMEAIRQRHTYAATDNLVLDVRMGSLGIMGDEVLTDAPRLDVVALGTGPIDRVDVLRDGEVVYSERPGPDAAEARFHWEDPVPPKGEKVSYYYVRVAQKDGQMAWGSPIWVRTRR
jgi:hypothetical protein